MQHLLVVMQDLPGIGHGPAPTTPSFGDLAAEDAADAQLPEAAFALTEALDKAEKQKKALEAARQQTEAEHAKKQAEQEELKRKWADQQRAMMSRDIEALMCSPALK